MKQALVWLIFLFPLLLPHSAFAQGVIWSSSNGCVYLPKSGDRVVTFQGIECLVQNILTIFISLIGVALFVMLIIGSFKLLTSGGDPKSVDAGKKTVTYAIAGLVIAISAWFVLNLIARITGSEGILMFSTQVNDGTSPF